MSPRGMSPGLPRYLKVEVLHEHPSRGHTRHPSMAHSDPEQKPETKSGDSECAEEGTGNRRRGGVSLTLAKLKALAGAGQVLAGWVLSPLQAGQHD